MRAPSRILSALLAGSLGALSGCKDVYDYQPATAADVRAATSVPDVDRRVRVTTRDARQPDGTPLPPGTRASTEVMTVGQVNEQCRSAGTCPLDDPGVRWELGTIKRVPDGGLILTDTVFAGVVLGIPTANVVCFGTNACSDGVKTGVIVTDVVAGVLVVGAFVVVLTAFRGFRGD